MSTLRLIVRACLTPSTTPLLVCACLGWVFAPADGGKPLDPSAPSSLNELKGVARGDGLSVITEADEGSQPSLMISTKALNNAEHARHIKGLAEQWKGAVWVYEIQPSKSSVVLIHEPDDSRFYDIGNFRFIGDPELIRRIEQLLSQAPKGEPILDQ